MDGYQILKAKSKRLINKYNKQSFDKVSLITACVDKSTIRAFHYSKGYVKKYKPLSIFRVWAFNFLSDDKFHKKLNERKDFQKVRQLALKNLENFWTKIDGGKPEFYQYNKLIDLMFKFLPCWSELDKKTKDWIFVNTNVPLDTFSLNKLSELNPELKLRKNISMNFIDGSNYKKMQSEIKSICEDIPVIVFDLLAWNDNHQPKTTFELIKLDKKHK